MKLPDAIRLRSIAELVPYSSNSRTHSAEQIAQVAASIREFGFTNPVLTDGADGIVAGHARVMAAKQLGLVKVPTIELGHLSEAQRQAYVIADNKLAENAGWDIEMLSLELGDLRDAGFDLSLTGFGELELARLLGEKTAGLTDPDDAPALPEHAVTQPGDVWLLGRHRLGCGDCTDADTVAKALNGVTPHLMVTDPPYGVEYDANWRNDALQAGSGARGAPGGRAVGKVLNDGRSDWREAWALFPGGVAYVWHADRQVAAVAESLAACKFQLRAQIVWVKTRPVIGRAHYHWQHEPCLYGVRDGADDGWRFIPEHEVAAYAVKDGATGQWEGGRKQSTVWNIEHIRSETGHSTQKPVECMKRPIENNSSPGQAVYEPFSGSGTTIIAAEMTGRACHAIELSPAYVDVAVARWQGFTGKTAILEADGRAFSEAA